MRNTWWIWCIVGMLSLLLPGVADAQSDASADAAIEELAHEAYTAGDFDQAARLWERLLADAPEPPTAWLYYAADAWSRAGDLQRASEALESLLAHPEVDDALAATLRRRLAAIEDASEREERLAIVESIEAGDRAFRQRRYDEAIAHWDSAWQRGVDPAIPLKIADALEASGRADEVQPLLASVATWERWPLEAAYEARLAALAPSPGTALVAAPADAGNVAVRSPSPASIALGATSIAAAVTSLTGWSVAVAASRRVDRQCSAAGVCPASANDDLRTRRRASTTGDVAAVVAGTTAVAWLVQHLVQRRRGAPDSGAAPGALTLRF